MAPAPKPCKRSLRLANAVSSTTGARRLPGSSRKRRVSSRPSMPGMPTSLTRMSGMCCCAMRNAVRLGQLLDDRQADARPARAGVQRGAPLLEAAEQALLEIGVDADAGVAHTDGDAVDVVGEIDLHRPARRRELDGVGDEVGDDP